MNYVIIQENIDDFFGSTGQNVKKKLCLASVSLSAKLLFTAVYILENFKTKKIK